MSVEYAFEVSAIDTSVAFDCEAKRAEREGFPNVAERQRANALHLRNAVHHMQEICPDGFRVYTKIVVAHVPDVNPVLRDDCRENFVARQYNDAATCSDCNEVTGVCARHPN